MRAADEAVRIHEGRALCGGQFKAEGLKPGGDKGMLFQDRLLIRGDTWDAAAFVGGPASRGQGNGRWRWGPDLRRWLAAPSQPKDGAAPLRLVDYGINLPGTGGGLHDFAARTSRARGGIIWGRAGTAVRRRTLCEVARVLPGSRRRWRRRAEGVSGLPEPQGDGHSRARISRCRASRGVAEPANSDSASSGFFEALK